MFIVLVTIQRPLKVDSYHPFCCYKIGGKENVPVHLPTATPTYCLLTPHRNEGLTN